MKALIMRLMMDGYGIYVWGAYALVVSSFLGVGCAIRSTFKSRLQHDNQGILLKHD